MAIELDGNVRMRGDTGPGVGVKILAGGGRLRLVSGNELVGDWALSDIGISALQEGFNVRVEGEEFILRTTDDVALAEELRVMAVSPRLGRRLAVRHNPAEPAAIPETPHITSHLAGVGFAIAGALIVAGGSFLNMSERESQGITATGGFVGLEYWLAFVIGGVLMIAVAYVMSIGARAARAIATVVLVVVVAVFGLAVSREDSGTSDLTAYGFIAGGLVVGVAVLVSGSLRQDD